MQHKVVITTAEWIELDKQASEHINRFAQWIADEVNKENPNQEWLASAQRRYELWKGISKALINEEELSEAEVYALERDPAYAVE